MTEGSVDETKFADQAGAAKTINDISRFKWMEIFRPPYIMFIHMSVYFSNLQSLGSAAFTLIGKDYTYFGLHDGSPPRHMLLSNELNKILGKLN